MTISSASELLGASRRDLRALLAQGYPIDPDALADTQYRGTSLGLPGWVEKLSWKKFMKTFLRDPGTGLMRGWNVRLVQDGLELPSTPMKRRDGERKTFGHYGVVPTEGLRMPRGTDQGLLIHYGLGGNRRTDPMSRFRDPIVALREGDPTLLLGWSYLDLGLLIGTPSFFTLELEGPLDHCADPPRRPRSLPAPATPGP